MTLPLKRRLAKFVTARAEEEDDPALNALVDACFDRIDVSPWPTPRTRFVRGDITDEDGLRTLAVRWVSHPDYPLGATTQGWHG